MENVKERLSLLWIVVMFNLAYVDIFSLFIPGTLDRLAEVAGDTPIVQIMLAGAIMMEIPMVMIILSRVLKYQVNRWTNIIVGALTIFFVIGSGPADPHYIFIATIEVVCLLLIIWYAWTWRKEEVGIPERPVHSSQSGTSETIIQDTRV